MFPLPLVSNEVIFTKISSMHHSMGGKGGPVTGFSNNEYIRKNVRNPKKLNIINK